MGLAILNFCWYLGPKIAFFQKCTFMGPQLNRRGLVWYLLNSSKAHAPRGLNNISTKSEFSSVFLYVVLITANVQKFMSNICGILLVFFFKFCGLSAVMLQVYFGTPPVIKTNLCRKQKTCTFQWSHKKNSVLKRYVKLTKVYLTLLKFI